MELARENLMIFSARQNIRKKNAIEEDWYLKNYMQDSLRKDAKNQNQAFTQHKRKEIEVREFNKNTILNKQKKEDHFEIKDRDSYIYGFRSSNQSPNRKDEVVLDPILEAGEKR